ncbi:MAG: acyl carrier protein [Clostridia bacterium]|nr:acyl carrier protein [Clostridia bacterium]
MEKIRIGKEETRYEIKGIRPVSLNVMQVVFIGPVPVAWGDITIYTEDGTEATTLTGYDTVYRDDGQTVYLSNDGSMYQAPETPDGPGEPPEPYVPTLEELQVDKRREVAAECERLIYAGINVALTDGSVEHYALTIEDQLNLFGKLSQITAGATQLEYHADGQPCRYYSAVDMQTIIQAAMWHVSYHTTYCNALNMWIAGCQTVEEVQEIFYGADVPKQYRSEVLDAYLVQIAAKIGVGEDGTPIAE